MKKIRVLIVDDHNLVRDGIRSMLEFVADVEVVGEAADGKEALEKVKALVPDVVLMDLAMPIMGGLEATPLIRKLSPKTRVLALTQYDDSEYVIPVIKAGACGFVTKMVAFSELAAAIHAVYRGESFLSPSAAAALIDEYQYKTSLEDERGPYERLTDREREILKLIVEGNTARRIAEMLVISSKTVEWYKSRLMKKLDLHNKTDLIKFAIRKRIIAP